MNKTININLGGIFFHIDEAAYHSLKKYLDAIKRSLSNDPQGQDEILADIEARIAELLQEKIKNERQVVNLSDIEQITQIMGQPEDYVVDSDIFEDEPNHKNNRKNNNSNPKKLFRDGDDKYLGGVCSGLAHYLGIEPIWARIIMIVLAVFWGTAFLIYPLLWILIPLAQTTAEKLQMKGEPVNISNIEKKIREELEEVGELVKDGVNNISEKVKNSGFKKKVNNKAGINEIFETIGKIITVIFKVIGKLIGVLLIFVAILTIIALIIGIFMSIINFNDNFIHFPSYFEASIIPYWILMLLLFIAIGIPFLALLILGLHIVSNNIKPLSKITKLSLLGIWIIAIFGLLFSGISHKMQTAHRGINNQTKTINTIANDTLTIKMIDNEDLSFNNKLKRRYNKEIVYDNNIKKLYSNRLSINIKRTEESIPNLKIKKESEGINRLKANQSAKNISYNFTTKDKKLLLNGYFLSSLKNRHKEETVNITINLPLNSIIYLDASTKTFLKDIDNTLNEDDDDLVKHLYKMTKNGLQCLDCTEENNTTLD